MMRGFVLGVAVGALGMGLYTGHIQINVEKLKKNAEDAVEEFKKKDDTTE
jgi:hypothetical protein